MKNAYYSVYYKVSTKQNKESSCAAALLRETRRRRISIHDGNGWQLSWLQDLHRVMKAPNS